jgi:hypothetical protein
MIRRAGTAAEVAVAVVWLLSEVVSRKWWKFSGAVLRAV